MLRLLGVMLIVVAIGLVFIFHGEIQSFSDTYLTARSTQDAVKSENWGEAIRIYEEKTRAHPNNVDLALTLGDLYLRQGQKDKAAVVYRDLYSHYPDNLNVLLAYGSLLQANPVHRNQVLDIYRKALTTHANNAELLFRTGQVFEAAAENQAETRLPVKRWLGDWAVYYYRLAIAVDPKFFQPRFSLGVVYQNNLQPDKAARAYCNALILDPDSYEARYNLGLTLVGMNAYDEAYLQFKRAVDVLSDANRMAEAQALAERVQGVKNTVFNQGVNTLQGTVGSEQLRANLNPACLLGLSDSTRHS